MEYTEIRCIIRNWSRYSQVHFLMPNIPWGEMTSDNFKGTYAYWSLIPRDLLWEWSRSPLFKPFFKMISTQAVAGMYMIKLEGVVDPLVEMKDYISTGEEIMKPLSDSYAARIENEEVQCLYHIGKCENYRDMHICKMNFTDHVWNFTVLKNISLFNSGISQYAEIMDKPIGKEVWDKMRKWVCFDLADEPESEPPYILKTTKRELYYLTNEASNQPKVVGEILAQIESIQQGQDINIGQLRAQFGLGMSDEEEE